MWYVNIIGAMVMGMEIGAIIALFFFDHLIKKRINKSTEYWQNIAIKNHEEWQNFYHAEVDRWQKTATILIQQAAEEAEIATNERWRGVGKKKKSPDAN